jgi:hypothetical protein
MAATVEISETNGDAGSPVTTDGITNINFGGADLPNLVPSDHPVVMSNLAPSYSYAKWLRFHVSDMGGSAVINVLKVWKSAGAYVTQEILGSTTAGVAQLNEVIPDYGYGTAQVGGGALAAMPYNGDGTDIFFIWSGVPLATSQPAGENLLIGGVLNGALSAPGYSNYAVMELKVDGSAGTPSGAVNQKVITFQYDES